VVLHGVVVALDNSVSAKSRMLVKDISADTAPGYGRLGAMRRSSHTDSVSAVFYAPARAKTAFAR